MERRIGTRWARGAALAALLALAGCDMDVFAGGGVEPGITRTLTVTVTNRGAGSGRVVVRFSRGTIQNPCPDLIGPGESCSPRASARFDIVEATVEVAPASGHRFGGWEGVACVTSSDNECTLANTTGDPDAELVVEVRFDPVVIGG